MSTVTLQQNAVSQLALQADAVGKLAQDTGAFAAVVAAFESNDPDALSWVLQRLELLPQCELICEWIRVKWCGLRCVEVCGPLDPKVPVPSLPQFARALTQLASNEAQLRRAVDAVSCGDADSFHAAIADAKLQQYCHLLCRYICSTLYRRICEVVCTRQPVAVADAALDIRADAEVLGRVVANEKLSGVIVKAAEALDCDPVRATINEAGFAGDCEIICRIICVWRSVWVCRALCLEPPVVLTGTYAVEEARNFALAARQLAGQPRALADLTAAVISNNAEAYRAIVDGYGLGAYCWQVCGWVCSELCYEFCVCVCPPAAQPPEWTNIGYILVDSDIDATGKTTVPRSGAGGVGYAFYESLQLTGPPCGPTSWITSGAPIMYRFMYSVNGGSQKPVVDGMLDSNPFQVAVLPTQSWPDRDHSTNITKTTSILTAGGVVFTCNHVDVPFVAATSPTLRPPPVPGTQWYPPSVYVWPDPVTGWAQVYQDTLGGNTGFMDLNSINIVAGADPNAGFPPTQIGAIPVPPASQLNGANVTLTFEATRVSVPSPPDYTQSPVMIRVNNNIELAQLTPRQFMGPLGCCTPISAELTVEFSVDHEEISSGDWSLTIESQAGGVSCSPSAPGNITPSSSGPSVSITARGGSGSISESTGGVSTFLVNPISASASDNTFTVASSVGLPSIPPSFYAYLCSTDEAVLVNNVVGTNWTVVRGQNGTTPAAAAAGTEVTTAWCNCSYQVWLYTTPRLTDGKNNHDQDWKLVTFCICGN